MTGAVITSSRRSIGNSITALVVAGIFLVVGADYHAFLLNTFLAYIVTSIGLVILVGWAGQVSFAQGAFFGIGAYVTAHIVNKFDPGIPAVMLIAGSCAAVAALPMAIPAVRLRGVYLALTTLAYQAAVERFLFRQIWFTQGGEAIAIGNTYNVVPGWSVNSDKTLSLVLIPLALLIFQLARTMRTSKVGRALLGLRRAESAMASCGVNIPRYRLLAFVGAAFTSGMGGCLLTYALHSAPGSNEYTIVKSTILLAIPVLGGITQLAGAVYGSALFVVLPEILTRLEIRNFNLAAVMGLGLLISAVALRGGMASGIDKLRGDRTKEEDPWLTPFEPAAAPLANGAGDPTRVETAVRLRVRLANGGSLLLSRSVKDGKDDPSQRGVADAKR